MAFMRQESELVRAQGRSSHFLCFIKHSGLLINWESSPQNMCACVCFLGHELHLVNCSGWHYVIFLPTEASMDPKKNPQTSWGSLSSHLTQIKFCGRYGSFFRQQTHNLEKDNIKIQSGQVDFQAHKRDLYLHSSSKTLVRDPGARIAMGWTQMMKCLSPRDGGSRSCLWEVIGHEDGAFAWAWVSL